MDTNSPHEQFSHNELQEGLTEFADLFRVEHREYKDHPGEDILRAYVADRLLDSPGAGRVGATLRDEQVFQKFVQGRLSRWMRSDVSLHVLTCLECQQRVASLRESRWRSWVLARTQLPREHWSWRRRFALGALAGAAAAAIIAVLWLWPPSLCQVNQECWQQVVRQDMKGGIMMLYQSPGRF